MGKTIRPSSTKEQPHLLVKEHLDSAPNVAGIIGGPLPSQEQPHSLGEEQFHLSASEVGEKIGASTGKEQLQETAVRDYSSL